MRRPWAALATILLGLAADDPPPRVVSGRVLDADGRPPRRGSIAFAPATKPWPFDATGVAPLDAEGRYKVELAGFTLEDQRLPADGPLRYLLIAEGGRAEMGKVDAGAGPSTLDLRLEPQTWKTTEFRLVDRDGKPVAGARAELSIGTRAIWERLDADAGGRCVASTPPGTSFGLTVRSPDHLPTTCGFPGNVDDPPRVTVPLFAPIRGRVVDPAGTPQAGLKVGRLIAWEEAEGGTPARHVVLPVAGAKEPATTDADGRFELRPTLRLDSRGIAPDGTFRVFPRAVCVADETFRRVAFLGVDHKSAPAAHEVTIRPARLVRVPLEHEVVPASGPIEGWWELTVMTGPPGSRSGFFAMSGPMRHPAADADPKAGDFIEAYWPEGRHRVQVNTFDPAADKGLETVEAEVTVPPGEGPVALPTIRLAARPEHALIGEDAPEIDARDLDTGAPVRLADLRGKVVVLDFWGHWCGPCLGAMPTLMEAHRRFEGKPVAILALHDQSVQTRAAYDRKLDGVKRSAWGGRDLPFRVALDRPDPELAADHPGTGGGVTCKRYQIGMFPTTLLIGRDGKVAGSIDARDLGKLSAAIDALLADPPR